MEEWKDVSARRNKGRQNNKKEAKGVGDVTKFFVSNFGYYGEVVSSYIAKKHDKEGKRFGFFSFRKVKNVQELETRMNGVKMGQCKLKVNVAKFAVENIGLKEVEERAGRKQDNPDMQFDKMQEKQEVEQQNKGFGQAFHPRSGLSFRVVLSGKSSVKTGVQVESFCRSISVPDNVVAFHEIKGKALIGRVIDLKTLTCMKKLLSENMVGGLDIVYVGGLSVLLNFHDKKDAVELLLKKEVWKNWFSVLDYWVGQTLPLERVAWFKIHGVPINIATNEVFDDVASQFGKVIHPSQLSLEDGDISVSVVGILVGDGKKVNDSVKLRWTNKVFKTWISEVEGTWEPECVGSVGKREVEVTATPVERLL